MLPMDRPAGCLGGGRAAQLLPWHRVSHRRLLGAPVDAGPRWGERFDAVIVPASRPAGQLAVAARAASRGARAIVVLASRGCRAREAQAVLADIAPGVDHVVLDLNGYRLPLTFECDRVAAEHAPWTRDTAPKRNVGLLIAHMMGWSSVLFLDDDVEAPGTRMLQLAHHQVSSGPFASAGWTFDDFPDHSVACHAYRDTGCEHYGEQKAFVGGGGLAVRTSSPTDFFPDVYNEDWLFLTHPLREAAVANLGSLRQKAYNPYEHPSLAGRQEFGDTLAEGIFALLHLDAAGQGRFQEWLTSARYWKEFIEQRRMFLVTVLKMVDDLAESEPAKGWMRSSLDVAHAELESLTHEPFVAWTTAWTRDRERWRAYLRSLPRADTPPSGVPPGALAKLNLHLRVRPLVTARR